MRDSEIIEKNGEEQRQWLNSLCGGHAEKRGGGGQRERVGAITVAVMFERACI